MMLIDAASIPTPVSRTTKRHIPPSQGTISASTDPWWVNLMAFESRLIATWRTRNGSLKASGRGLGVRSR